MNHSDHRRLTPQGPWSAVVLLFACIASVLILAGGCRESESPSSPGPSTAKEIVFYGFAEDMPQTVLDAFTREYGIAVRRLTFQSPEEAENEISSGREFDVALVENQLIPALVEKHLVDEIDLTNIPNFKYISANFRDLVIDPGNRHSIPASYGTTGLIVRTDLVGRDLKRWEDLWQSRYAGKIGLRAQQREIVGMTLLSLGYPSTSENPQHLAAVQKRLQELKPAVVMVDIEAEDAVRRLLQGDIAILHGYAEDYHVAHESNAAVAYVLPVEGTPLWAESYIVPGHGRHRQYGELFINFLLRPEITAQIINEKKYAQPNDAALSLLNPEIRNDPVVFPGDDEFRRGFIITPLSQAGQKVYDEVWTRFMGEKP